MCSFSRGCRSAIFASAAMFPPARSPTGRAAFSQAFQNQSSEPSVHQAFWRGWLKVNRNPSMPGRSRQWATMFSRSGLSRSKCPRMQNWSGCRRAASTARTLTASPSELGGWITAQSTPAEAISASASSTEKVGIWRCCALILPFCQRWIWESTISMASSSRHSLPQRVILGSSASLLLRRCLHRNPGLRSPGAGAGGGNGHEWSQPRNDRPTALSPGDIGANIGPDRLDLIDFEGAAPGRHLALSIEHGLDEASMILGAQTPQVERHAAARVLQPFTVTRRTVVPVNSRARLDLRGIGVRLASRADRDQREYDSRDNQGPAHPAAAYCVIAKPGLSCPTLRPA